MKDDVCANIVPERKLRYTHPPSVTNDPMTIAIYVMCPTFILLSRS